jgi:histidinol-phosphate aminotransferase
MSDVSQRVRPLVRELHAYLPGEQPKISGLIKLNTNENPYPPSPKVLKAIRSAADHRLRLYPNPTADRLRAKLAKHHGCQVENIIIGNGSDELLALATRAFVEPATGAGDKSRSTIQYFTPSYSLYPVLADIHGALKNAVPLNPDFALPTVQELHHGPWELRAALTYVTTPNAPSGRGYSRAQLDELCRVHEGVLVLDETYVDFANENALSLALKYSHVIAARTFSKAYSLCFLRVGYFVGHPELIAALHKVRDSYNVNGLAQVAAEATLHDLNYYRRNFRRIIAARERLTTALKKLGFEVLPSQANFIFTRPPIRPAREWVEALRAKKILVRWWDYPAVRDYLRITIGTEQEMNTLVRVAKGIISRHERARR